VAEQTVNTSKSLKEGIKETAERDLENQVKEAAKRLKADKQVKVSIPKGYEKFVGPTVPFGINGVMIVLPVDGKEYEVPAPFKEHIQAFLDSVQM
jgi:hypothetical protein